jgi:hypothetical protein
MADYANANPPYRPMASGSLRIRPAGHTSTQPHYRGRGTPLASRWPS